MGVFQRISDMTKASVHEVLDKVEDPVVMLNQYLRDMEEEIEKAEVTVAKQIANERKLNHRLEEMTRLSEDREHKAIQFLKMDDETAAQQALGEKLEYDEKIKEYTGMYQASKIQAEELSSQLKQMKSEFYQLRNKRNELVTRANMAKAKKQMAQVSFTNHIESGNASRGFHRMEEKIMELEVEAEMVRSSSSPQTSFSSISTEKQTQIDDQLATLKEKMNS